MSSLGRRLVCTDQLLELILCEGDSRGFVASYASGSRALTFHDGPVKSWLEIVCMQVFKLSYGALFNVFTYTKNTMEFNANYVSMYVNLILKHKTH